MNTPQDPSETLKQRRMKRIAEAWECVDMLRALDFINQHPEYNEYKQKLIPYSTHIKRAQGARNEIRDRCDREKREWLKGHEEFDAIEQHLIESLKPPAMPQSEYQALDRAYQEQKKTDSIERWNKLPIIIFGGGFLPRG